MALAEPQPAPQGEGGDPDLAARALIELGPGIYGVGPAAERYFGRPAADLDEDDAALLAASLPRPSQWHPGVTSRAYQRYAFSIRSRMGKAEFLWKQI